jgi:hypothetical protein
MDEEEIEYHNKKFSEDNIIGNLEKEYLYLKRLQEKQEQREELVSMSIRNAKIHCPVCNSTEIQVMPKKWSEATGVLDDDIDMICINCKHEF